MFLVRSFVLSDEQYKHLRSLAKSADRMRPYYENYTVLYDEYVCAMSHVEHLENELETLRHRLVQKGETV